MRIERLRIPAFGTLAEWSSGDVPLAPFVVLQGPNEAGKSTFFELLTSLLYGFYPASRDAHPYTPHSGLTAEGWARIRLSDERVVEVHRRLLSSPVGTLRVDEVEEELRNRTLPQVEHVPRGIFRHVYALTLAELAQLEGESWAAVQDRLLGGLGARDLRPVRLVADELEAEARRLWRDNRMGNQEVRDLEEQVRDLRVSRLEAVRSEQRIRGLSGELAQLRDRLERARDERLECELYVERYRGLLPIREKLARISDLHEAAGDPAELESLPAEPGRRLDELRSQFRDATARADALDQARMEPRKRVDAFGEAEQELVERRSSIDRYVERVVASDASRLREAQLVQELRDLDRRIETRVRALFDRGVDDPLHETLRELPVAALREAVREADAVRSELSVLKGYDRRSADRSGSGGGETGGAADDSPPGALPTDRRPRASSASLAAGLVLVGVALLVWGWLRTVVWAAGLGGSVVAVGLALEVLRRGEGSRASREYGRARESAKDRAERSARLRTLLTGHEETVRVLIEPVRPGKHMPAADAGLPAEVERLQELLRDRLDRARGLQEVRTSLEQLDQDGERFRALEGMDPEADVSALGLALPAALRRAELRAEEARAAGRELDRLEMEERAARADAEAAAQRMTELTDRLRSLRAGPAAGERADDTEDAVEAGLACAVTRLKARHRATQLTEELERTHADLDETRARIDRAEATGEDWTVDDGALERRLRRERELRDEIEELNRDIARFEHELEQLGDRDRLDEVDGRIEELGERRDLLTRRRDRLWTLARVLRAAERELREEHQPGILREAGRNLAALTGGRYDRILLGGTDGRSFRVRGTASPEPAPIEPPLSTGTREQIYFALRLAILNHLDRAGERLPLFLDEVFVNWDAERRDAGLKLLARTADHDAGGRQVFLFTCHEELAEAAVRQGATRVRLDQPGSGSATSSGEGTGSNPTQRTTGSAG